MFLKLNHQNLEVYKSAKKLLNASYDILEKLPDSENFNLKSQLKRASTSVLLNISEGSSRKSKTERNRFYEIARGSIVEIDTCCEVIIERNYIKPEEFTELGNYIVSTFILLSNLLKS
ncbi:four helix bundle protein [Elizabethkingia anophelis]|uniref:four helix bundle protein n=1 Tax=Elizabethkingia anophelis TaxID=1117645 RepID=UPI0004E36D46|nr:four helix bundle protein [Elizabethkingia anophelis]KFC39672.1 30S ribosomal protein S23 [Elizabethkingia anophelis]MCT3788318.1 four helix bundle protein [Elizabethkingia anophelis]MDV3501937.1 four helix bundle protein [Elizabethkingia anophelis]